MKGRYDVAGLRAETRAYPQPQRRTNFLEYLRDGRPSWDAGPRPVAERWLHDVLCFDNFDNRPNEPVTFVGDRCAAMEVADFIKIDADSERIAINL